MAFTQKQKANIERTKRKISSGECMQAIKKLKMSNL